MKEQSTTNTLSQAKEGSSGEPVTSMKVASGMVNSPKLEGSSLATVIRFTVGSKMVSRQGGEATIRETGSI